MREICRDSGVVDMSTMALSWLCQQDQVSSVITGARTPEQVEANCKIVELSQVNIPDAWMSHSQQHSGSVLELEIAIRRGSL
jgi:aryl-alcohol dehydrogenase-like predicted oxidoreductase